MELRKRVAIFMTFVCFSLGITLLSAALGTEHWIESRPRVVNTSATAPLLSSSPSPSTTKNHRFEQAKLDNRVNSGLFAGTRNLNYLLGFREKPFSVRAEMESGVSFMWVGMWISVIVFTSLSMLWAAIGMIFSLVNTIMKPIETITGPLGLYVWSSLAAFCGFVSIVLFLVQYFTEISQNVLLKPELEYGFTSHGHTWLGYSFWLVVSGVLCFLLNIFLLLVSGMEMKTRYPHKEKEMPHITDGGVLMY